MADLATRATDELLAELDGRVRSAWRTYAVRLDGLTGRAYEDAERDGWAALQAELRDIDHDRDDLARMVAEERHGG